LTLIKTSIAKLKLIPSSLFIGLEEVIELVVTLTVSARGQPEPPIFWNTFITLSSKNFIFAIALTKNDIGSTRVFIAITIISNTNRKTVTSCKMERY
jgi:hypothetical protein